MAVHITKGEGAPTKAPEALALHYVDTLNKRSYFSVGTQEISDWILSAGSGASGTFTALTDTPSTYIGQANKILLVNSAETGLEFAEQSGGGGSAVWGDITGTLSDQTDLQDALNLKQNFIPATTIADVYLGNKTFTPSINLPISTLTQDALDLKLNSSEKGAASGVCPLDAASLVPAANLPSYVSNVEEYPTVNDFPAVGSSEVIYISLATNLQYRWSGSQYIQLTSSSAIWGNISGTLSTQTDLQNALNAKEATITPSTINTFWRGDKNFVQPTSGDVGLGNVDNTSDASKPISTATQAALDDKEDSLGDPTVNGYVLTSTTGGIRSWVPQSGGGGGAEDFTDLGDTPSTYFSSGGFGLRVASSEDAVEFYQVTTDTIEETLSRVFLSPTEKTQIGTNSSGVSSNATAIGTNAGNISSNTTAIGTNTGNISSNATAIGDNTTAIGTKEDGLGNPTSDGQVLSSTTGGTRSWINAGGGGSFDSLTDTPASKANNAGAFVIVNAAGTDLEYSGGNLWTPADLSVEPISWVDASDESTITESGGNVSLIADKTSNGNDLSQGTGSQQPETGQTLNGLNVLTFDRTTADALVNNTFPIPTSGNISVFTVQSYTAGGGEFDSLLSMDSSTRDWQVSSGSETQFNGRGYTSGIGGNSTQDWVGGPFNGPSIYNSYFNRTGNGRGAYVDGVEVTTEEVYTAGMDASQILRIMANRAGAGSISGILAEMVIVEDQSVETRQLIEGYLKWKWNLAALPSGHPYEFAPPTIAGSGGGFTNLRDTPRALGASGQYVKVNGAGDGLEFGDLVSSDSGPMDGGFTSGTWKLHRSGDNITFSFYNAALTVAATSASSTALIPEEMRPPSNITDMYDGDASSLFHCEVTTAGVFTTTQRNYDGTQTAVTAYGSGSITWVID